MKKHISQPPFNIILLGDPAAGKGTQADRLIKKYGFYDLDMGREVMKPENKKRYDYAHTTAIGKLTPTIVVRDIFKKAIATTPLHQGILFNGTPKMINEAKSVAKWLKQYKRTDPLVIYLSVPMSETLRRAIKRHEIVKGKKIRRDDDNVKAIQNRHRYYKGQVSKVVIFFKTKYAFKRVSGMGTEAQVWKKISAIVEQYEKNYTKNHGA